MKQCPVQKKNNIVTTDLQNDKKILLWIKKTPKENIMSGSKTNKKIGTLV